MNRDIRNDNSRLEVRDPKICDLLAETIHRHLASAEANIWHGHPVWFLDGNPTVGYSMQNSGIRLMFWNGAGFDEPRPDVLGEKFKDASIFYQAVDEVDVSDIKRWLEKSRQIAWDYKNITNRKWALEKLK